MSIGRIVMLFLMGLPGWCFGQQDTANHSVIENTNVFLTRYVRTGYSSGEWNRGFLCTNNRSVPGTKHTFQIKLLTDTSKFTFGVDPYCLQDDTSVVMLAFNPPKLLWLRKGQSNTTLLPQWSPTNDSLGIVIDGDIARIRWYDQSTSSWSVLDSMAIDDSKRYLGKVSIKDGGNRTGRITTDAPLVMEANPTATLVPFSNPAIASITLNPSKGTPPYTYLWDIDSTSATVTGLSAGLYSVRLTDNTGDSLRVYQPIDFGIDQWDTDLSKSVESNGFGLAALDTFSGTPPNNFWGNIGAVSLAHLEPEDDGYVGFVVHGFSSSVVGLIDTSEITTSNVGEYSHMDYCLGTTANQKIVVIEGGGSFTYYNKYKVNDTLRIQKVDDEIWYWHNDIVIRRSPLPVAVPAYRFGVSFNEPTGRFNHIHVSSIGSMDNYFGSKNADTVYAQLKDEVDGSYHRVNPKRLLVRWDERYVGGSALKYRIFDWKHENITAGVAPSYFYGPNWLRIDLDAVPGISEDEVYTLQVFDVHERPLFLRFKVDRFNESWAPYPVVDGTTIEEYEDILSPE